MSDLRWLLAVIFTVIWFYKKNTYRKNLQSKLNCEVLYDDLAFEVRWAVAGESVVVQLVAKLGKSKEEKKNINLLKYIPLKIKH